MRAGGNADEFLEILTPGVGGDGAATAQDVAAASGVLHGGERFPGGGPDLGGGAVVEGGNGIDVSPDRDVIGQNRFSL